MRTDVLGGLTPCGSNVSEYVVSCLHVAEDVMTAVGDVNVTAEQRLRLLLGGVRTLAIDAFIKAAGHHSQGDVLESCDRRTPRVVIAIAPYIIELVGRQAKTSRPPSSSLLLGTVA